MKVVALCPELTPTIVARSFVLAHHPHKDFPPEQTAGYPTRRER